MKKRTQQKISYVILTAILVAGLFLYINRGSLMLYQSAWSNLFSSKPQDFITLALSVIIEALPFVILGVLVSVVIQLFLPQDWLITHLPRNTILRRAILSVSGIALPVCECGNVPVARSLISKGLSPADSLVFLLAAPIINPITYLSTVEAFRLDRTIVAWRFAGALVIANVVGSLVGWLGRKRPIITKNFQNTCEAHDHQEPVTIRRGVELFYEEFWTVFKMLGFGALIAAASQVFIPRETITAIGSNGVLSILAMIGLAFVISICSNIDAFFALTYARTFSAGSIVSFLTFGPMVDIKMLALMKTTYRTWVLVTVSVSVFILTFALGLLVNYVR